MIEIDNFTDVPRTSKYQKPVSWARYAEIAKGITKTTFDPKSVYTKTQIVKFIYQVEHTALWTMDWANMQNMAPDDIKPADIMKKSEL